MPRYPTWSCTADAAPGRCRCRCLPCLAKVKAGVTAKRAARLAAGDRGAAVRAAPGGAGEGVAEEAGREEGEEAVRVGR